jgi:pimeloyl-ACP methyl ester carboxylesterase
MRFSPLAKLHPHIDWGVLFGKLGDMQRRDFDWSKQIAALTQPTMLVLADADAIQLDDIVECFKLLGGGQRDAGLDGSGRPVNRLAIVPGATHYNLLVSPVVAELVGPFLEAPEIDALTR